MEIMCDIIFLLKINLIHFTGMKYPQARVLIFIKSPIAGLVKTRLMPTLTAQQACDVYQQLLTRIFTTLTQAKLCPIECWCTPDTTDPFIAHLTQDKMYSHYIQPQGDLGERMYFAAQQSLQSAQKVVLIGADCPPMSADYIEQAIQILDKVDSVLGPSEDGGYVLLGLTEAKKHYFENIKWGTDTVLETTRLRMKNYAELNLLWDLDTVHDLKRSKIKYKGTN